MWTIALMCHDDEDMTFFYCHSGRMMTAPVFLQMSTCFAWGGSLCRGWHGNAGEMGRETHVNFLFMMGSLD